MRLRKLHCCNNNHFSVYRKIFIDDVTRRSNIKLQGVKSYGVKIKESVRDGKAWIKKRLI